MKKSIITIVLALLVGMTFGQKKVEKIEFFANGICGECTERIEYTLDVKGVKLASFDLEKQQVTVIYKTKKISEDQIHSLLNNVGYDTDKSKANPEAREALPLCCKEAGHCEDDEKDHDDHDDEDHDHGDDDDK